MKTKAIIFDVDGVLLSVPHFFTEGLQKRGYSNAVEIMNEYYKNENTLCAEGKGEAVKLILPYLEKILWNKGAEEYFKQQFEFEGEYVEESLVTIIQEFQNGGIKCYLGTDQEENRAKFLLEDLDFQNIFEGHFISCRMGSSKGFSEFWDNVKSSLSKEGIKSEEIIFFDDLQSNIDIAKKEGIESFLFTDMKQFNRDIKNLM